MKKNCLQPCEGVNDNVQVPNLGRNNPSLPSNACGIKMEKPKLAKLAGDVREYAILKLILNMQSKAGISNET